MSFFTRFLFPHPPPSRSSSSSQLYTHPLDNTCTGRTYLVDSEIRLEDQFGGVAGAGHELQ